MGVKLTVELESGITFSIPVVPVHLRDVFAISRGQKMEKSHILGPERARKWAGMTGIRRLMPDSSSTVDFTCISSNIGHCGLEIHNFSNVLTWRNGKNIP